MICQALLPAVTGDRYHLATECLTMNQEAAHLIATVNFAGIRGLIDLLTVDPHSGSHSMNDDLQHLIKAGKVGIEDARRASTDLLKFGDMVKELRG